MNFKRGTLIQCSKCGHINEVIVELHINERHPYEEKLPDVIDSVFKTGSEEMSENYVFIDTPWGKEAICPKCGSDMFWEDCWNCEEGYSHHDCGEDTCCCLDPRPNVKCDICNGKGGWFVCLSCKKASILNGGVRTEDE